jgi:hypothetical protein
MPVTFESETDTAELRRSPEPEEQPITKTNGQSSPLGGGTVSADGVNFSVFSRNATSIELLSVERVDGAKPARVIRIDPVSNRTYQIGMYSSREHGRGKSMPIASMDHSIPPRDCDSSPRSCCWIPTAVALLFWTAGEIPGAVRSKPGSSRRWILPNGKRRPPFQVASTGWRRDL